MHTIILATPNTSLLTLSVSETRASLGDTRVGIAARTPLCWALVLCARQRRGEVLITVGVAEKNAFAGGADVGSIAVELDRMVALTVPLDPAGDGPLGDAPCRIVLGATAVAWASRQVRVGQ